MSVKVTRTGELPTQLWDGEASREAGAALLAAMDARIFDRGFDVHDQPFRPYSAGYATELRRAGQSTRVDLNRSGRLRLALARSVARATPEGVTLYPPAEVLEQANRLQSTREFWGVSPADEAALAGAVEGIVERAMGRGER